MNKQMKTTAVGGKVVDAWQRQTIQYLSDLQAERDDMASRLADLDDQIDHLSTAMSVRSTQGTTPVMPKIPTVKTATKTATTRGRSAAVQAGSIADTILGTLSKKQGISVPDMIDATGLERRQITASLMNLKKQRKVRTKARGVYVLA